MHPTVSEPGLPIRSVAIWRQVQRSIRNDMALPGGSIILRALIGQTREIISSVITLYNSLSTVLSVGQVTYSV